jgi:hypothetical protein
MVVGDGRGLGAVSDSRLFGRGERGSYVPLRIPRSPRKLNFFSLVSPPQAASVICFFFFRYVS